MKRITLFFAFAIAITGIFLTNTNAQSFVKASTARSMDEQIHRKLKNVWRYGVFDHIDWDVNGSIVTLTGKVYSLGTKGEAAKEVERIPGVTEVINNIETLPASPMDDQIRRAAFFQFMQRGPGQYFSELNPQVRIIVDRGRLTLEGQVARQSDKDLLNVLAHGITGVFVVNNNLVVGQRAF